MGLTARAAPAPLSPVGVFTRQGSPFYQLWLEGHGRETTRIRIDAATSAQKRENRLLAEQQYHRRMTALARAAAEPSAPARPAIRFEDYATWYERHVSAHKRGRVRESEIIAHLCSVFGPAWLTDVTVERALEWKTARLKDVAASTWNRELDVLKHMLAQAVPKYLERSPLAGMRRQRTAKSSMMILSPDDERKLLAVLAPDDKAMVLTALDTLMRLSDVLNLRRVDDHGTYLTVLDPKTEDTYKVPVSTRLRAALDALGGEGEYYFIRRRIAVVPRDTVRQVLERACEAAGIAYGRGRGITFHGLRHTGASRMVEAGIDLRTVQELGGWKSLRQLTRYTHPTDAAKLRAVEMVGKTP